MKWQDISVDIKTSSRGGSRACPGAIYMYKIMKKLYKIRLQRDFLKLATNDRSDKMLTRGFCWHQIFVPWGCQPLTCGYIQLLNHEKMCIKSEVEENHFKLATNDHSDESFPLTSKFCPNGLSVPALGLCLNLFSSITADFNISSALRWAIQDH